MPRAIFHTDRGSTYTTNTFTTLCQQQGTQSMGRVGSRFDNATPEAFFSYQEQEVLSHNQLDNTRQTHTIALDWRYEVLQPAAATQLSEHDEPGHL